MSQSGFLWPDGWTSENGERCQACLSQFVDISGVSMRRALDDYRRALSRAHHGNEFLDLDLADLMLVGLHAAWEGEEQLTEQHRHWLCLATAYLVDPNDQANDFTDLSGLDDDAHVVSTTLRAIGLIDYAQRIEEAVE